MHFKSRDYTVLIKKVSTNYLGYPLGGWVLKIFVNDCINHIAFENDLAPSRNSEGGF